MNKTDELLSRLQALEPPVIDNPDELTERIMQSINAPTAQFNAASQRSKDSNVPAARVNGTRRTLFRVLRVVTSAAAVWLIGLFFYVYSVPADKHQQVASAPALSTAGSAQRLPGTLQIVRSSLLRSHQPQIISYTQLKKQMYEKD
jgi:hypothetical protein